MYRYIKIQPKQMDLRTGLCGINTEFGRFVPREPNSEVYYVILSIRKFFQVNNIL